MNSQDNEPPRDFLWLNLRELPYFRGLLRAVEARHYQDIELPQPVLDIGCGDGHFASATFKRKLDVGIDPYRYPIREAIKRAGYHFLIQADAAKMPFPGWYFGSVLSNSVLEHIQNVQEVLLEIARVLKPGGHFAFSVPNQRFTAYLSLNRVFDKLGLPRLGDAYGRFFNRIARHHHLDAPEVWIERLERAGFKPVQYWHYYSPEAMRVTEWGHYLCVPCLLYKKVIGRWILVPRRWNLNLTYSFTRKYFNEPQKLDQGVCTFYVARRV